MTTDSVSRLYRAITIAFRQNTHWSRPLNKYFSTLSGVFRERATVRCPPPFGRTMKIFYRRLYMKRCVFAIFQQELQNLTMFDGLLRFQISEKWANLRFPLNTQKQKMFQLQGGFTPDPPTRGFAPGSRWGLRPQTPCYRLALHARHGPPFAKS